MTKRSWLRTSGIVVIALLLAYFSNSFIKSLVGTPGAYLVGGLIGIVTVFIILLWEDK